MEFSEEQLKKLSVLFEEKVEKELTIEEVRKFVQLDTIDDCDSIGINVPLVSETNVPPSAE